MTKIEDVPVGIRVIATRAGLDEDEILAMVAQYRDVETDAMLDRELGERLLGLDLQMAAEQHLRAQGIVPDDATQEQLLGALKAVSA